MKDQLFNHKLDSCTQLLDATDFYQCFLSAVTAVDYLLQNYQTN